MKICLSLCAAAVFGGWLTATAQVPANALRPHSLSLAVDPVHAGSTTQIDQDTHNAGTTQHGTTKIGTNQTQTTQQSAGLSVTVRNFGQLPDTVQVEWYFVASPVSPDMTKPLADQQSVFDSGSQSLSLAPGATQTIPVESKEVASKIENHNRLKMSKSGRLKAGKHAGTEVSGSKMDGWMVRVVADGKVIDAKASKDALVSVAKDDAKLNALKD